MENRQIKKISKYKINSLLKQRKLENISLITEIENKLLNKREKIIQLPPKGSSVLLILSGGLDSVIVWGYLMEIYHYQVYPIFFRRGQRRVKLEEKSVDYFFNYYRKKYHTLCQPIKKMVAYIPPLEIHYSITIASNEIRNEKGKWLGIPMYSSLLMNFAVQYGYYLEITKNIKTRTIFAGFMATDGLVMKDETLTAMRVNNLSIAELTEDYSWQIIALPIEKELGFFHGKEVFVRWAVDQGIPIEKTRSCIMWGKNHCGKCVSCFARKEAFKAAKVKDLTVYGISTSEYCQQKISGIIKKIARFV